MQYGINQISVFCPFSLSVIELGIRFQCLDHPVASIKVLDMPTQLCHSQIHPGHLDKLIPSHIPLASHFLAFLGLGMFTHAWYHSLFEDFIRMTVRERGRNDRLVSSILLLVPFSPLTSSSAERFSSLHWS